MVGAGSIGQRRRMLCRALTAAMLNLVVLGCGEDEPLPGAALARPATGGAPSIGGTGGQAAASGAASVVGTAGAAGVLGGAGAAGTPGELGEMAAALVFAPEHVLEYHVTIAGSDLQHLEEHGDDEVYVPASLVVRGGAIGELALGSVGIRHKGSYTLHHCWDDNGGVRNYSGECAKLSYKLDFAEYDEDTRFYGLKKLNLHASSGDVTKLRELLAYGMFRDFGVDAPRIAPARVYINAVYAGVFLAVEEIDGRYTAFHFPAGAGDGNLYKEIWPRAGLDDSHFIAALETNEERADVTDMQGFAATVGATSAATFEDDMAPWVDLEALLRYVVVDRATKNWDGIMSFYSPVTPHNFYWYSDEGADPRFHLIPWDLDNTFWEFDPYMAPEQWVTADPVPDFNERPANCDPRPIWDASRDEHITPPGCDPLLGLLAATQWERFVAIGHELLAGPLQLSAMDPKLAAWRVALEPLVREDPTLDVDAWRGSIADFRRILERAISDFEGFLAEGYHDEFVEPPLLEPSTEELARPLAESGLVLDAVNNYEFIGGAITTVPADTFAFGGPGTTQSITWNTTGPLAGLADLRFDFEFARQPGAWDEWVTLALGSAGSVEQDISVFRQISITLRADRARRVRVRLNSPAYDDTFGGAWTEFGSDFDVTTAPTTVKLKLGAVYYPEWARAAWSGTQGWSSDDAALGLVLTRFTGLLFAPSATTDGGGEMTGEVEPGFMQIDNIYFQ